MSTILDTKKVTDNDAPFVIDAVTREITTKNKKRVLIQGDHNSERFTFEVPRFIEGRDVGLCNVVQVVYINIDKRTGKQSTGVYTVDDMNVYPFINDIMTCTWLISYNATRYEGSLSFMLRFAQMDGEEIKYAWHTDVYEGVVVAKSLDAIDDFTYEYMDVIAQWKNSVMAELSTWVEVAVKNHTDVAQIGINATNIAELKTEQDVQKARMDTFTSLPNGSTTGDAELADARIAADGTAFPNVGDAIRDLTVQYEGMKDVTWTYGYLQSNGHVVNVETSDRMKTNFIPCGENIEVKYYAETNHASIFGIAFYDKNKNLLKGFSNNQTTVSPATVTSPIGTAYVRISSKLTYMNKTYIRFSYKTYAQKLENLKSVTDELCRDVGSLKGEDVDIPLRFYLGTLDDDGEVVHMLTRLTTKSMYVSGSYILTCSDKAYQVIAYYRNTDGSPGSYDGWTNERKFTRDGYISVYVKKVNDTSDITADEFVKMVAAIKLVKVGESINTTSKVYVSPNGDDTNPGSFEKPLATIERAVSVGYRNICVLPGEYKQKVNIQGIDDLSIYAYNGEEYDSTHGPVKRSRPAFINGTVYDNYITKTNGIDTFKLTEVPSNYNNVFINKTLKPVLESTRPTYNAGLWANHTNKYEDYKLKPVLSTNELLAEEGTFYYDGSSVYVNTINDTGVVGYTAVEDLPLNIFQISNCNNLTLSGIVAKYAVGSNFSIRKCNNVRVINCEAGYTMQSDNFTGNYSDITFDNCVSYKARNDGFNTHYYGISIFNNCRAIYNYDDGESSHEYCKVIVNGGEFAHNYKGGHSPVGGCQFEAHGDYCHDNAFGYYLIASAGYDLDDSQIRINSGVSINNTEADIAVSLYDVAIYNTRYKTTRINSGTLTDLNTI